MKSGKGYIFLLISFLFILIASSNLNLVQAASYDDKGIKADIDAGKVWTVRFNKELDENTVNDSVFSVTDENDQPVSITVALGEDKKSVTMVPKNQYAYGKTYSLFIKDGLKAINGAALIKPVKLQFKIKDNAVVDKGYTVTIDAGHGGSDSGNIGQTGVKEKDVNLSVALKAGKILEANGVKVVYTRNSDSVSWNKDNELKARFDIANNAKSDFFVSIHCNSYPENLAANGIETYYADSDTIGQKFAQSIQDELIGQTSRLNRGVKVGLAQHEILRGTVASAVMVQLGFLTNAEEGAALGTEDYQNKSASAIANGILKSLSYIDKTKNLTISSVQDLSATVVEGNGFALPLNIPAVMSDGSSKKVNVIWSPKTVDTTKAGTYSYQGVVAGYERPVNLSLVVKAKPDPTTSKIVVLDAGHGIGRDTGATGITGVQEDDVTLSVTLKAGKILESRGVQVVYTRTTDQRSTPMEVIDSLQKRCDISNEAGATYFVSIHNNSAGTPNAYGTETYYYAGNSEGQRLASEIQSSLVSTVGSYDRGVKTAGFYVIKNTAAPAALVELGFLSNPDEESKLASEEYQAKYAEGVASGILRTLGM